MSRTIIYYKTFPLSSADGALSSPTSVAASVPMIGSNDANDAAAIMEPISLGRPAKIRKVIQEEPSWICSTSSKANRTKGKNNSIQNIIQPIVDEIKPGFQRIDEKEPVSLATADSTFPHLPPCREATEAIVQALIHKPHTACYTHASGSPEARRAIALHHSFPGHNLNPQNVIVTNGCSGALELTLSTILDEGTTLLVPQPGLPLYEEIAESLGANVVRYRLDPNRRWECDMNHLEEIMAGSISNKSIIRAMVINNPSSHGSVFSENHLEQLLDFALKHRIPIVADEVYGNLTFGSNRFHPIAKVAVKHGRKVPVITTSGLSKQFMLPGWRIGWCTFQDNTHGSLREVERGAHRINKFLHGVSHLQQSVIPIMLSQSTAGLVNWKENLRATLERQANILCSNLNNCHCLNVAPPQGSMYTIVDLDPDRLDIDNDIEFTQKLVQEENVFVLPGSSFGVPDTFRVAFSASETILEMASQRILDFCSRHRKIELKEEKIR